MAFIINLAVAVYLLYAKRLFGLRGGGRAERAEREADTGWTRDRAGHPEKHPRAPVTGPGCQPPAPERRAAAWAADSRRVAGPGAPSVTSWRVAASQLPSW